MRLPRLALVLVACVPWLVPAQVSLPATQPLTGTNDLAADMVRGLDRYLDRYAGELRGQRDRHWYRNEANPLDALERAQASNRPRLARLLGVVDAREQPAMRFVTPAGTNGTALPGPLATGPSYRVFAVEWDVFRGVKGEGLLLVPDAPATADVIAVPDCDWTPEQAIGLVPGVPGEQQFPRRFAEAGCRVLVPALVDRGSEFAGNPGVRSVKHSQRETLWRAAYEIGRHPLGYEIQKLLAAADWMAPQKTVKNGPDLARLRHKLAVVGYGEGGLLALYASALDPRFDLTVVSGVFGLGERNSQLPIYRNVWSLLEHFGDAEIVKLIAPRRLLVEAGAYPVVNHTDQHGGAPGTLWRPTENEVLAELERARSALPDEAKPNLDFFQPGPEVVVGPATAAVALKSLGGGGGSLRPEPPATGSVSLPDTYARAKRQYLQLLEDTQHLMRESEYVRRDLWKQRADFSGAAQFTNSTQLLRQQFRDDVVGLIPAASLPPNVRTRLRFETNGVRGYDVVLDVHPDVFAYGILCVPGGLESSPSRERGFSNPQRRPVVVCQHGLEGRPSDVSDPAVNSHFYHQYGLKLAEQGYVTFAPQNPYIGQTTFRQVLRKAQPLGLTLWSFIHRQHEVITDWLAAQDFVDPARIAFYGLSYGGKSAMRVPILVDRYCLSICSADYNEWIWKNVSARSPYGYLWTSEYDMPEWNLANQFNYAELSWLIFPRPFMVERGHDDGVAPDEWVAYEYAKTRRHYVKMGLADRTEIEFFDGPHSINGKGTFEFLRKHLKGP
jgi:dienelactone hydrolase